MVDVGCVVVGGGAYIRCKKRYALERARDGRGVEKGGGSFCFLATTVMLALCVSQSVVRTLSSYDRPLACAVWSAWNALALCIFVRVSGLLSFVVTLVFVSAPPHTAVVSSAPLRRYGSMLALE